MRSFMSSVVLTFSLSPQRSAANSRSNLLADGVARHEALGPCVGVDVEAFADGRLHAHVLVGARVQDRRVEPPRNTVEPRRRRSGCGLLRLLQSWRWRRAWVWPPPWRVCFLSAWRAGSKLVGGRRVSVRAVSPPAQLQQLPPAQLQAAARSFCLRRAPPRQMLDEGRRTQDHAQDSEGQFVGP